jgi:hypothetical protein
MYLQDGKPAEVPPQLLRRFDVYIKPRAKVWFIHTFIRAIASCHDVHASPRQLELSP